MKTEKGYSRTSVLISVSALAAALVIPTATQAQVTLTANDAAGTSSFNAAGHWSSAAPPASGSTYSTVGYLLRGPSSGTSYTFAGDGLTVGGGNGGGTQPFSPVTANNNALLFKVNGQSLTINNLTLDGAQIRDGLGDGNTAILNGSIAVTANGGAFMAQDTNIINSSISGSSILYIGDNGSGNADRVIVFTSASSTFTGSIMMTNTHASVNYSRLMFAPGAIMNFNIGANGINNSIFGQGSLTLGGNFAFNLASADNTLGDSWLIVDQVNLSVTYGGTFLVNGFTQNGTVWDDFANGVDYEYNTANGILSVVPEPGVCGLGLMAGAMLLRFRRKR